MKKEATLHLSRADACMVDADLLLAAGRFEASVGRSYYAMFHAATAALLEKDVERGSHHGVISAFGEFLAKPGLIDRKYHRYLREGFDLRQESDYQPIVDVGRQQATKTADRAKELVAARRVVCG